MTTAIPWQALVAAKLSSQHKELAPYLLPPERLPPPEQRCVHDFFNDNANAGVLTGRERAITEEGDAAVVLERLRSGEWSCTEVLTAYIKRATIIHQLTNTLTEPLFTAALSRASTLDALPAADRGPLHGLPVTLKDQFHVPGADSTLGYVSHIGNAPSHPPSALVQLLTSLGAIVFAKTNLPQSIMWCETNNNIFGLTTNPRDREFTPGGSSGGEGVNLAMAGALVGWGTDIGGSIRIPSALMGIYGLKPSTTRLPYEGVLVSTNGQEHNPSVVGPMARSLSSLTLITKAVLDAEPWHLDPKVAPLPWREDLYQDTLRRRNLVFGVLRDDGMVRVHPPVERVLAEAVAALRKAGHEVIEWSPEGHEEAVEIMDKFYTADGGTDIRSALAASGEPPIPHVSRLITRGPAIPVFEYWQLNRRKWAVQKAYLDRWTASSGLTRSGRPVDLLVTPVMPHVAVRHEQTRWVGYTKVWNVLDYPAGVLPAGRVCETDERREHAGRGIMDADNWELYDPVEMRGHPVGLQVVGRRLQEEKVLAGMKVLEEAMASGK